MLAPIAIMSFNRAQFLGPVLLSIKAQQHDGIEGREIHLFQDGAVNRYSHLRYAHDADIAASIALFQREFPNGVVHASNANIGICENFRRAEEYLFCQRGFPCAWFFEDDLVLSPSYFAMMEHLQNFTENVGSVAYFAAYGNFYASSEELRERRRSLMTLDHHWGFGLMASHWKQMQPLLTPFYNLVVGEDYSRRNHQAIFSLYEKSDKAPRASSQDAAKAFACDQLGLWRCNTVVPFAKYIGTTGQHMTPELFAELGFRDSPVEAAPLLDLQLPGSSGIRELVLEQRKLFSTVREVEYDAVVQSLPPRSLNPSRLCSRADIQIAYYLLLRRSVESEDIFERHVDRRHVFSFVLALSRSNEFLALTDRDTKEFTFLDATSRSKCSKSDIRNIYSLLCNREPEAAAIENHDGRTYVDLLTQGVFRSAEFQNLCAQYAG